MLKQLKLRLCLIFGCSVLLAESQPTKRQAVSINDLINSALTLVQPIFDTSQAIQESPVIPQKVLMNENAGRETQILGAPKYSTLMEVPICRGNSKICRFISCTAYNFKHDDNFANLNLAAQLMGDKKMRKVIGSNSEAVGTVCREQGMSAEQCRLFARGFQLIDRFMSNMEKPTDMPVTNGLNDFNGSDLKPFDNDAEPELETPKQRVISMSVPRSMQRGSQTWSTHRRVIDSPKPVKQVIRHSTTNRSQPLGITESSLARQQKPPVTPPFAQRPPSTQPVHVKGSAQLEHSQQTTERNRSSSFGRSKRLPELEEEEGEDDIYDYRTDDSTLARPRAKRADDYYDQVETTMATSSSLSRQQQRSSANKINCLQYLSGI